MKLKHGEDSDKLVQQMCHMNGIAVIESNTQFFGAVDGVFDDLKPMTQNWLFRSDPAEMTNEEGIKREAVRLVQFLKEHSPQPDKIDVDGFEARIKSAKMG